MKTNATAKDPKTFIRLYVPSSLKSELKGYADDEGRSLNSFIARLLEDFATGKLRRGSL